MVDALFRTTDSLSDFESRQVTLLADTRRVWIAGTGPAVIVMAEIPGITPHVARFARWVRDAGFTVWMPHLFGTDGAPATFPASLGVIARACIRREFAAFAAHDSGAITVWLRALASEAHAACGGKGVGAIGMCFTGNFALSMMLEKAVLAPVLAQPSLPVNRASGLHIARHELAAVKRRMDEEQLTVLAYRFAGDPMCRAARFSAYERALGDRFVARVLPDSCANRDVPLRMPAHSVVTNHLIDRAGEPTRAAVDEILGFFRERLLG